MLNASMVRKGKMFDKLRRSVKNLNKQNITVGHFAEQGLHYSGMTYPQLLAFWFTGVSQEGSKSKLRQDARGQFIFNYLLSRGIATDLKMKLAMKKWAARAISGDNTATLLDDIGKILRQEYSLTFNVKEGPHMLGTETPLFETGDLQGATAYKTSKSLKAKAIFQ